MSLGDCKGGELQYWAEDDRSDSLAVLESRAPMVISLKDKGVVFDGRRGHAVMPFEGTRYSLVFFTTGNYWTMTNELKQGHEDDWF